MKNIRFKFEYEKFPSHPHPSTLMEVFVVADDLHPNFVSYDTQIVGGGKYNLPSGKKIVLLLRSTDGMLWTTIRRHTDEKESYYRRLRGHAFGIIVSKTNASLDDYF